MDDVLAPGQGLSMALLLPALSLISAHGPPLKPCRSFSVQVLDMDFSTLHSYSQAFRLDGV